MCFLDARSEGQLGCTLGGRGEKDRLSLACFLESSTTFSRTAPAPLRGKSQLGRQGAKSGNDPRFCIAGLVVGAVVVLAECELERLHRARQRVLAGFKQQVDVILHEHIGIIDMTQGL